MTPALVVLAIGLPTTAPLVIAQVVLSCGIPFALTTDRQSVNRACPNVP